MKYAITTNTLCKQGYSGIAPWIKIGAQQYNNVSEVKDNEILVVSHYPLWNEPVKSYISEGRPYIEIDFGYWGATKKRRITKRVSYNNFNNITIKQPPFSRKMIFQDQQIQDWKLNEKRSILMIEPNADSLTARTGESLEEFKTRLENLVMPYWKGNIVWRKKQGPKGRWDSFKMQIQDVYAVVGERTTACVEACLLGIPGFSIDTTVATLLTGNIKNLNSFNYPNRDSWFEHICWSQFTEEEFLTLTPAELTEQYQIL